MPVKKNFLTVTSMVLAVKSTNYGKRLSSESLFLWGLDQESIVAFPLNPFYINLRY